MVAGPRAVILGAVYWVFGFLRMGTAGMTAQALVLAGEVADAVQVPIDAVRYEGDAAVCTVKTVTGAETRRVKTGRSNAFFVEITEGLAEGDVVLLGR